MAHFFAELVKTYKFEKVSEAKCKVDPVPMLSPFGGWFIPGEIDVKLKLRNPAGEKFEIKFDTEARFKDTVKYLEGLGKKVWDGLVGHPKKCPFKHSKK